MKMPRSIFTFLASLALVVALLSPPARGAVMVSNLDEPTFSSFPAGEWWVGNRFITDGSADAFLLEAVTLKMDAATATPGNFFVAIYSNGIDNKPAASLGLLSGEANPFAAGNYPYTASGLTLNPNTSYWIVAGVSSGGSAGSGYNWTLANAAVNYTGSWAIPGTDTHITSFPTGGVNWNDLENDGYARQFSITATAVPEPSTFALCAAVALGAVMAGWPRRRT